MKRCEVFLIGVSQLQYTITEPVIIATLSIGPSEEHLSKKMFMRENVVSYLPKAMQGSVRHKLQEFYQESGYERAKDKLSKIRKELQLVNQSAVSSLDEGLEETLTLHRLGLLRGLGISFKTTNCIESLMALIGQKTDKVDYWKTSDQKHRWLAADLLDIEARPRKGKV